MKKFSKELLTSINIKPFDLEYREIFIKRFTKSFDARATFKNKLDRILAADQIWENSKANSLVSISTSREEYLLFN
jgi:hypothetical protein